MTTQKKFGITTKGLFVSWLDDSGYDGWDDPDGVVAHAYPSGSHGMDLPVGDVGDRFLREKTDEIKDVLFRTMVGTRLDSQE